MKKNILLYVVNVDWFFLSHRLPIALGAKAQGYDVHVLTVITDKESELKGHGFTVHSLSVDRGQTGPLSLIKNFLEIWKTLKKLKPDLIHLITIKSVLLGGIAARISRQKGTVVAFSGLGSVFVSEGFVAKLRRFLVIQIYKISLSNTPLKIIFQNSSDRDLIKNLVTINESQIVMIPGSGVDLKLYNVHPFPEGRPVVMFAARLLRDKGTLEYLEAVKIIINRKSLKELNPRFVLVGEIDPDNPSSLTEEDIHNISKESLVEFWGYQNKMYEILPKASVIVLPSYREGLPKILIEAAACGRPVITTDVPGCRDAIIEGKTGLLVPPKDSYALSNAIESLLLDRPKLHKLGIAGSKLAEQKFDINNVVSTHLKTYNSLLFTDSSSFFE